MKNKPLLLPLLALSLFSFLQCADDLDRLELASNLQVILNVYGVNNLELNAEVKNLGSFDIVDQGFLFSFTSFDCEDNVELVDEVQVTLNNSQDFEFEANKKIADLNKPFFVRAFVEVLHPVTKERRRICSELPVEGFTGGLALSGNFEELVDKRVRLRAKLNGLEDNASVQEHGFFWLVSDKKLLDLPSPQSVFDTVETQIERLGSLDENGDFRIEKEFRLGTYYYAIPFVIFDGIPIFDPEGYQEIFIGDFWVEIANDTMIPSEYPQYLAEAVSFVIGDYAYIGTGFKFSRTSERQFLTATFWRYDPANNSYLRLANYPGSEEGRRSQAVGFALNGKGYVGTGHNNAIQFTEFHEYTPETDEWRRVKDFPIPIRSAAAFVIDGYAYVGTGWSCWDWDEDGQIECGMVRELYRFDPNDATEVDTLGLPMGKWEKMASMDEGVNRRSAVGFALNGVGYIATGVTSNAHSRGVYAYYPETNEWIRKGDMPGTPRQKSAAFTIGNRAYIAAGTNSDVGGRFPTFKDLWEYNPDTDNWLQKADIGFVNLDSGIPFSFKGKAYMYGGFITEHIESISHYLRVYTPEKDIFESTQ